MNYHFDIMKPPYYIVLKIKEKILRAFPTWSGCL